MRLLVILACIGLVACAKEGPPQPARPAAPSQTPSTPPITQPLSQPPVGSPLINLPDGLVADVRSTISVHGGALPPDMLTALVERHKHEIVHCYEIGLTQDRYVGGNATFAFTTANGSVSDVHLASDAFASESTKSCVRAAIQDWTFPPSPTPVSIEVNYVFAPAASNDEGEADIIS